MLNRYKEKDVKVDYLEVLKDVYPLLFNRPSKLQSLDTATLLSLSTKEEIYNVVKDRLSLDDSNAYDNHFFQHVQLQDRNEENRRRRRQQVFYANPTPLNVRPYVGTSLVPRVTMSTVLEDDIAVTRNTLTADTLSESVELVVSQDDGQTLKIRKGNVATTYLSLVPVRKKIFQRVLGDLDLVAPEDASKYWEESKTTVSALFSSKHREHNRTLVELLKQPNAQYTVLMVYAYFLSFVCQVGKLQAYLSILAKQQSALPIFLDSLEPYWDKEETVSLLRVVKATATNVQYLPSRSVTAVQKHDRWSSLLSSFFARKQRWCHDFIFNNSCLYFLSISSALRTLLVNFWTELLQDSSAVRAVTCFTSERSLWTCTSFEHSVL